MAVNLTPQYHEAEEEYRKAQTPEDRLACLRKMYALVPKHKASEKLQADLKTKISDTKKEVESAAKAPKKSATSVKIPRQGAGQILLVGAPNAGKSSILAALTNAKPVIADYPFSTREPSAGMMEFEKVKIQLIDIPPVSADFFESYTADLTQAADAVALVLDLADDDGPFACETVIERLGAVKKHLVGELPEEADPLACHRKTLIVATKSDAEDAEDRLEIAREMFGDRFPFRVISVKNGSGLDDLRADFFKLLDVMRIFAKKPGKPADMEEPFTCPVGSTLAEFAGVVHRDLEEKCKSARVWGSGVTDGQTVGREHVLSDGDVVELQV